MSSFPSRFTISELLLTTTYSPLTTPEAVAAVVTQVAVAVADGDGAAVIATGGIGLEHRKLLVARGQRKLPRVIGTQRNRRRRRQAADDRFWEPGEHL